MEECPFRTIGIVKDRCIGGCKPLEAIFRKAGLNPKDAKLASGNVLAAYYGVNLSDKARDGRIVVRSLCQRLRNKLARLLPKELNQFLVSVDQGVTISEKTNVSLERYLELVSKAGEKIFTLAIPKGLIYDQQFLNEAGNLTSKMMVMGDMKKDLPKDTKSGQYNPLKNREILTGFNELYDTSREKLKTLMAKTKIEQFFTYKGRSLCLDKRGGVADCCAGMAVSCIFWGCYAIIAPICLYSCLHGLCANVYNSPPAPDPMPCNLENIGIILFLADCCIPVSCIGAGGGPSDKN